MKKMISIVIPAYNEEDVIDELAVQLKAMMAPLDMYDFEVIIVENGSWDSTYKKLMDLNRVDPRFKVVQLSRNFGCDGGITAGLKYATGDAAIIMMADLQDPPEMIPRFIEKWEEGYDIVYTIVSKRTNVRFTRRISTQLFYKISYLLTDKAIPENVSDFRLIDRKVYGTVNSMHEKNRMLRGMIAWSGFKQLGIPYERPPRFAGESKAKFFTVLKLALDGIYSFSYFPLKIATLMGFGLSAISLAAIVIEIVLYLLYGREVPGYTTLIIAIFFLFSMVFLILGIMGEYIARIYDEVKQRPNFIVRREIGF